MICDEVMSGCGRTGHFYAYMDSNIKPDIIFNENNILSSQKIMFNHGWQEESFSTFGRGKTLL